MVKPLTIAIIGGGFSGTMVATHLLRLANCPLQIKLIEKRANIGQGLAYSTAVEHHVLNVPAGKMSAFPQESEHFINWLQNRYSEKAFTANSFVSRHYYGEYLQSILQEAHEKARKDVQIEHIHYEATELQPVDDQVVITCGNGRQITADRVVLALGNLPPSNPPIADPSFYQSRRYQRWAWSTSLENIVQPDDAILLIGSGLTALDLVVNLHYKGHQGKIYMISKRGLVPQAHQQTPAYPFCLKTEQNLNGLFKHIRQEVKKAEKLGYDWRSVMDALRPHTQDIWKSLTLVEKRRFIRHLRAYWDNHRHRIASGVSDIITKLRTSQQLSLYAGEIIAYQEDMDGVTVTVRPRGSEHTHTIKVQTVINCTGSERLTSQWQYPLLKNIISTGVAQPDALELGLEVADNGSLVSRTGAKSTTLYTLGPLQKGCLWETTAVQESRQQAEKLATTLLDSFSLRNTIRPLKSSTINIESYTVQPMITPAANFVGVAPY
ncbi:oxidoreductase [Aphanothece hegewaldii CCALA 016]|uniref:Oxidoreductase n=1 Tax=Aphanothece hegewaldii CCALA 016 TaxID=2107694 RepID=A0A2T1LSC1_9CHRO|nr:FAD/NAD(P)-binding protein [Aphanothece hegewaldii]PSF32649.1 oxidoreductase [Aphanothece hegewaldii CCALA 016]